MLQSAPDTGHNGTQLNELCGIHRDGHFFLLQVGEVNFVLFSVNVEKVPLQEDGDEFRPGHPFHGLGCPHDDPLHVSAIVEEK